MTIGIVGALMLGMTVGVVFAKKPLRGSCGGVGPDCACDEAGIPRKCEQPQPAPPPLIQLNRLRR